MNKEKKTLFLQWLILLAGIVIVIMLLLNNFYRQITLDATNQIKQEMVATVEQYALEIHRELECAHVAGNTVAQLLSQQDNVQTETVHQFLMPITETTSVSKVLYCTEQGETVDQNGNRGVIEDITDFPQNGYMYQEDEEAGEISVMEIISVSRHEGRVILYYPMDKISSLININHDFDRDAFLTMVDREGEILWSTVNSSSFLQNDNIWENVEKEYSQDVRTARARMRNTDSGSLLAESAGESRLLVYAPIEINSWAVIVGASEAQIDTERDTIWVNTSSMLYELLAAIFVFAVVVVIINLITRLRFFAKSKALEKKADTDLLTGLTNKLATEQKIKEFISQNPNGTGMMFLLDIDNFKKINDTMGHAFGDEVLRSFGMQISSHFRMTDIIGRTGGDEFTIFLKNVKGDDDVIRQAEKLENFFKGFQVGEYVKYSVTASIGAAVFPQDGADFESLYLSADKAVYKAKDRGRNQLAFYDDRDRKE